MAEKGKYVLPPEYDGKVIDEDEYMGGRRESALAKSRNRTSGYVVPNSYKNCIATATDNYGQGSFVTGNHTFYANPERYGFRRLKDGEPSKAGDLVQAYTAGYQNDLPYHSYIVNEVDDKGGIVNVNYASGDEEQRYYVGSKNHWGGDGAYRYRYIGTPAERAAIAEHNAAVRAANAASAQPIAAPAQGIPVQHAELPDSRLSNVLHTMATKAQKKRGL